MACVSSFFLLCENKNSTNATTNGTKTIGECVENIEVPIRPEPMQITPKVRIVVLDHWQNVTKNLVG